MTLALLSAAAAAPAATRLDPVELFLQADIIVQAVMLGLILASIWVWMIIVSFSMRIGDLSKKSRAYEAEFWEQRDQEGLLTSRRARKSPRRASRRRGSMNGASRPPSSRLTAMPPASASARQWTARLPRRRTSLPGG